MDKAFLYRRLGGTATSVGKALGYTQQAVSGWPQEVPDKAIGRIYRRRPDLIRAWWLHLNRLKKEQK